jgi:serine/threonine protein kinase
MNIAHRDIKMDNIMLSRDQKSHKFKVKLIDFGISESYGFSLNSQGRAIPNEDKTTSKTGTFNFQPPELFNGKQEANSRLDAIRRESSGCLVDWVHFVLYGVREIALSGDFEGEVCGGYREEVSSRTIF